jgi:hypothetical protein
MDLWWKWFCWVMFVGKNEGFLSGTRGHRTFGEVFFELDLINGLCTVFNAILHETVHPLLWVDVPSLDGFVTNVTEFHGDSGTLIFIHNQIARAAEVGHLIYRERIIKCVWRTSCEAIRGESV